MISGLPTDKTKLEPVRLTARKLGTISPIPPEEVETGSVMQNTMMGSAADLLRFPAIKFHASDGGRYIATGDSLINRDPDSGYVDTGTYWMQLHDANTLDLWMNPGQQGSRRELPQDSALSQSVNGAACNKLICLSRPSRAA